MKRNVVLSTLAAVILSLMLALSACTSYNKIFSAYQQAGYTESDTVASWMSSIQNYVTVKDENGNEVDNSQVTIHALYHESILKGIVVIAEFSSSKALAEQYAESEDLQNLVKDLQKSDLVKGNCVLLLCTTQDGKDIFINA